MKVKNIEEKVNKQNDPSIVSYTVCERKSFAKKQ